MADTNAPASPAQREFTPSLDTPPTEPSQAQSSAARLLARIFGALRDFWLIVGVTVLMFLALECVYRIAAAVRHRAAPERTEASGIPRSHPYADSAWFPGFLNERDQLRMKWRPYVYGREGEFHGRYINIDSAGLRMVPRYPVPGGKPLRVFLFGGSTTWGQEERDSATRAADIERDLAARGYDAEVVNFGQPGYTMGQELITLELELRKGNVPNAVIFWDGVNDVGAMRQNGVPGLSYREYDREDDLRLGTARRTNDGRVSARLAIRSLASESAIMRRLFKSTERAPRMAPLVAPAPFCRMLMNDWLGQARLIDHLAAAYGFTALVIWQPQWQTTNRPQSAFEKYAETNTTLRPGDFGLDAHRQECARVADSLVAAHASPSILNWATLHSTDTATVFLDLYSHPTERAAAIEADTLTTTLVGRIRR